MSGAGRTFEEQATAVHGMPAPRPTTSLAAPIDQAHGRTILRGRGTQSAAPGGPAGHDVFQELRFEIAEVAEVLVLETQARVYEEVAITKEALDRIETVTATLRRQEAEVVVEDAGVSRAARTGMPPTAG